MEKVWKNIQNLTDYFEIWKIFGTFENVLGVL